MHLGNTEKRASATISAEYRDTILKEKVNSKMGAK
jgi:hypothetical protein